MAGILAGLAVLALATGCGGDDEPALVTTTSRVVTTAPPTTAADPTTTTAVPTTTTTADQPDPASDSPATTAAEDQEGGEISFRVARQESTRDGTVLHLEVPPGDYTDVDLENLVLSIYEERDDLYELHVLDSREAVSALLTPESERTPEQKALLESHYLVSFLEGSILRFQGPFANLEGYIVGS
ncbi:MAG: hypothetical protein OXI56_02455 [bacterium]|nr:hypothetical protein [bacterium]MDE0600640.1 hypothetical protein [bacterium]